MKAKNPARLAPAGFWKLLSFFASTYLLPALDGALGTTRTTRIARTTGTAPREMTNAAVAIASAISNPKACASKENIVVSPKRITVRRIRNEYDAKYKYFLFMARQARKTLLATSTSEAIICAMLNRCHIGRHCSMIEGFRHDRYLHQHRRGKPGASRLWFWRGRIPSRLSRCCRPRSSKRLLVGQATVLSLTVVSRMSLSKLYRLATFPRRAASMVPVTSHSTPSS